MRTFGLPLLLALISIAGIVGMLVFDGAGDALSFVLAALPLAAGTGAFVRHRAEARRSAEE